MLTYVAVGRLRYVGRSVGLLNKAAGFSPNKQSRTQEAASVFYNLTLKVIYCHLCCILLVT